MPLSLFRALASTTTLKLKLSFEAPARLHHYMAGAMNCNRTCVRIHVRSRVLEL
jgi:hypothetical protein